MSGFSDYYFPFPNFVEIPLPTCPPDRRQQDSTYAYRLSTTPQSYFISNHSSTHSSPPTFQTTTVWQLTSFWFWPKLHFYIPAPNVYKARQHAISHIHSDVNFATQWISPLLPWPRANNIATISAFAPSLTGFHNSPAEVLPFPQYPTTNHYIYITAKWTT